ncbi:MAG: AMP-binding protein [Alphaproteobacteria bacterium]|nr:AMP-binding protein [Alphaproteobacteria bacterium]
MAADTIVGRIAARGTADPERLFAIVMHGRAEQRVTYASLLAEAARVANGLAALGVGPGGRVVIVLDFSADCYFAFLGALLLGAEPAFLAPLTSKQDPALYYDALPKLLERLAADALVTSAVRRDEIARVVPDLPARVFDIAQRPTFSATPPASRSGQGVAFLQLSSGTTGLKKAVALPDRAVLAQVDAYAAALGLGERDVIASWLPLYHDMGLIACMILPMITGVPVVALDALHWVMRPATLLAAIEHHRASLCWLPNFAFHHLAAHVGGRRFDLSSMRAFINCSEPCKPETFALFLERFGPMGVAPEALQCCYAMAETVFAVSQSRLDRPTRVDRIDAEAFARGHEARPAAPGATALGMLSCGALLPTARVRIVDAAGADLPERRVGEIWTAGDCLFDGYVNQPDATAERLLDGWYRTGDLGYLAEGELFVVGRQDDLIISNGRNHYAHELERVVSTVDGVIPGRCVALGVYNPTLGSQDIVVLAEGRGDVAASAVADGIRLATARAFDIAVHAVHVCAPGQLVKTTSGKISRSENLRRYQGQAFGDPV